MTSKDTNEVRDALINAAPNHASVILARDQVVEKWCKEHGITKDQIGMAELLKIRALPEWKNAK